MRWRRGPLKVISFDPQYNLYGKTQFVELFPKTATGQSLEPVHCRLCLRRLRSLYFTRGYRCYGLGCELGLLETNPGSISAIYISIVAFILRNHLGNLRPLRCV